MQCTIDFVFIMTLYNNNIGNWNPSQKTSLRLIIGAWCLATLVLLNAYGSVITSFLTVTKLEPIVNTLEELADTRQPLKLMMIRHTPREQRFLVHAQMAV